MNIINYIYKYIQLIYIIYIEKMYQQMPYLDCNSLFCDCKSSFSDFIFSILNNSLIVFSSHLSISF